jgi:hypothetical protein
MTAIDTELNTLQERLGQRLCCATCSRLNDQTRPLLGELVPQQMLAAVDEAPLVKRLTG